MTVDVVCAWCGTDLGRSLGATGVEQPVSHGICGPCAERMMASECAEALDTFLDRLGVPVLVVDAVGRVVTASAEACRLLGRPREGFPGLTGGDVFNCLHASLPGGCGRQQHCVGCTIRLTVMGTMTTGQPAVQVEAIADTGVGEERLRVAARISTERVGGVVWLRIDDLQPVASP